MRIGATIFNQNYTDWDRYEAEERGDAVDPTPAQTGPGGLPRGAGDRPDRRPTPGSTRCGRSSTTSPRTRW